MPDPIYNNPDGRRLQLLEERLTILETARVEQQSEIESLKTENAALRAHNADLEERSIRNAAKISKDRHQRQRAEMAVYVVLGMLAVFAIGYKRQVEGTWTWDIPAEIALAVLGGGGLIYKMIENPDEDS